MGSDGGEGGGGGSTAAGDVCGGGGGGGPASFLTLTFGSYVFPPLPAQYPGSFTLCLSSLQLRHVYAQNYGSRSPNKARISARDKKEWRALPLSLVVSLCSIYALLGGMGRVVQDARGMRMCFHFIISS